MKICFIGLGSIGCRHLKNLVRILNKRGITYTIDALRSSERKLSSEIEKVISNSFYDVSQLPRGYDIIFITNPTSMHYNTLLNIMDKTISIFIEKPAFDNVNYDSSPLEHIRGVCYVACPLRYTGVMQRLKSLISDMSIFCADVKCSSYLPEWHPGQDYRTSYSSRKEMGGGVDIDLIHEWDYLIDFFGYPKKVMCLAGKYSNLEINSNDVALYIAQYEDKLVQVHLNYFGRVDERKVTLYTDRDVIEADLINGTITFLKTKEVIHIKEERDEYQGKEIEAFLDMILSGAPNTNDIGRALQTLKIATAR